MSKLTFTTKNKLKCFFSMTLFFTFLFTTNEAIAQCSLACNGSTQVSLDNADCEATITAEMILNDQTTSCPGGVYVVTVLDATGIPILTSPIVTSAEIGQTLSVMVTDVGSGNACWSDLVVEDKLPPVLTCADVTINCYDLNNFTPMVLDNCDSDPEVTLISDVVQVNDCLLFPEEVLKVHTMVFQATDESGNVSGTCQMTVTVERIDNLGDISCPQNYLMLEDTNLECDGTHDVITSGPFAGHPAPSSTGVPYLDTDLAVDTWGPVDLNPAVDSDGDGNLTNDNDPDGDPTNDRDIIFYPDPDLYCNILVSFTDINLGMTGCVEKIMRTWNILEWSCSDPQRNTTCVQIIEIVDDEAPVFTCPADFTVTTNITGTYNSTTHGAVSCAANVSPATITPVDNCTSPIEIDITYPGGFIDNYSGIELMELPLGANLVTYTVYDGCYNSSSCTMTVTVIDNTSPVAICDQYTVVSLSNNGNVHVYASVFNDGSYDDCALDNMLVKRMDNGSNCGLVENVFAEHITFCCDDIGTNVMVQFRVYDIEGNYNECMVEVEVQDKLAPVITCPANVTINCDDPYDMNDLSPFGTAMVSDNCGFTVIETPTANINQCNIGTITRRFLAEDQGGRTDECTQTITLINPDPFDGTSDITWPSDLTMEGCSDPAGTDYHPDITGYPSFLEDQCDLVGSNWDDQLFPFNNNNGDACFKILRTWTVIDWCQFNSIFGIYPSWTYTQVIKVNNTVAPIITSSCDAKSTCTFDADCMDGFIELTATATDDCTDVLDWWANIDYENDGSFDETVSGTGSLADASDEYPIGNHVIYWSFKDRCGNVTTCSQDFSIVNCKAPTPYCLNGLAVDLMPVDTDGDGVADWGMVELWASDFDQGSFHPCGYPVILSFSSDITDTNMEFNCNELGDVDVTIYASIQLPTGSVVQAFCNTFVDVQDNNGVCAPLGGGKVDVVGRIATEMDVEVSGAMVDLGDGVNTNETDTEGLYAFPEMPTGGSYDVNPSKEDDAINGVTTLDLLLIQRHILGQADLDSQFKIIAADINHDEIISVSDLLELRKLILGINEDFENNESWRFVDNNYTFFDITNPLAEAFNETYKIDELDADMQLDFTAIKVGDVNNTVVVDFDQNVSNRNDNVAMIIEEQTYNAGDIVIVPFTLSNSMKITGLQFAINISNNLEFNGIEAAGLDMTTKNYHKLSNSLVTSSWNTDNEVTIGKNDVLFTMSFVANASGTLSNDINLNALQSSPEVYNQSLELHHLDIEVRTSENGYALYQNAPNPFNENTTISFEIPKSANVTIKLNDVSGKLIQSINRYFEAGLNSVVIERSELDYTGVLYYTFESNEFTATKKMVVLK